MPDASTPDALLHDIRREGSCDAAGNVAPFHKDKRDTVFVHLRYCHRPVEPTFLLVAQLTDRQHHEGCDVMCLLSSD